MGLGPRPCRAGATARRSPAALPGITLRVLVTLAAVLGPSLPARARAVPQPTSPSPTTPTRPSRPAAPATSPSPRALGPQGPGDPSAAIRDEDAPPPPAEVMSGYRTIRAWLDGWAIPASPPADLPSCAGASVVLRFDGKTIGRASELQASAAAVDRDNGPGRSLWRVYLEAFSEADRRIPVARDALRQERLREAARSVQVSIELAGIPTPIEPAAFGDLDSMVAPGVEGVAVRIGNRVEAAFPSSMLLSNLTPAGAARALVSRITGSAALALGEPRELRDKQQLVIMRFRVTHLAQSSGGMEPRFLLRGARTAELADITVPALRRMAADMAHHLRTRESGGDAPIGLRGAYHPWSDAYEPKFAAPHEQALAALALRRFASRPWAGADDAKAAAGLADRLLHDLDDVDLDEPKPWDDAAASALCVLALREPGGAPFAADPQAAHADLFVRCGERIRAAWLGDKGFEPGLTPPVQAAVAAAWLRLDLTAVDVKAPLRRVLRDTPPAAVASLLPLVGWAELEAAGDARVIPSAVALRQARVQLWTAQLQSLSAGPDRADMIGGVPLAGTSGGLPTWVCLRPLAFVATMLRHPELTPAEERSGETVRLVNAARFLRQLQVDEHLGWMLATPGAAQGGIRAAPWDQSMPTDATSVGLLFTCELLDSLDALAKR